MNARQEFKMEYWLLRCQFRRHGCNRESWIREFVKRGGACRAAALVMQSRSNHAN